MSKIRDEVVKSIADFIGEGVHTGLRKWCESDKSHEAWLAIRDMPGEEWSNIALELAKYILEAVPELAIVDREAEIPDPDPHSYEGEREAVIATKSIAFKEGWVKEVKDG